MLPLSASAYNGTASVSPTNVIYSGSYSFVVQGGPPNTCGELNIQRNGNWEFTSGWLCTDGSGNATKGPWNWTDKANDETGDPLFIRWPDNTTTNSTFVIVDKQPANTYLDSSWGAPPTSYYGHATDAQWGAGFDFGGTCVSDFRNLTTGLWWDSATGNYSSSGYKYVVPSRTRVNRWYVSWSTNTFPRTHTSGNIYEWYTCCHDGNGGNCTHGTFTP
jgi:hypothetical protein